MNTNEGSVLNSSTRGANESEKPKFITVKDGFGNDVKHLNFDNPEVCPREGIIQLVPLKTSSRHQNNVGIRSLWDRKNSAMIGIPLHVDPETKRWVYQKITLIDNETLDLRIEEDAKKWAVIRNSNFLEGSPNLRDKPIYKVHDVQRDAERKLQMRAIRRRAEQIADQLMGADLVDMARNIGIDPDQGSTATTHIAVIEFAEKDPKKFMEIWDSPTRKELTLFKKAYSLNVIDFDTNAGYMYGNIALGISEPMVVMFLKENINIFNAISILCDQRESDTIKAMSAAKAEIKDEKDLALEAMAQKLKEAEEKAKKLEKLALESKLSEDVAKTIKDPEHQILLEKAKKYKIHGYALMKKDKLAQKIEQYETQDA